MQTHLIIYLLSFIGIWIGSGFVIRSVAKISGILRLSSFVVSFLILGAFTSVSELSVGLNSIIEHDPEIYVGNLIGASMVLFLLIIPLLAIFGKSIRITPELQGFNLPASLVVILTPTVMVMDGIVGKYDAILSVVLFILLLISIQNKDNFLNNFKKAESKFAESMGKEIARVVFGVFVIFLSSRLAVEQTHYFSVYYGISPFLVSLVLVAIGTNLPELSLAVRSIFLRNHQIAFGDYVGSAAFNTFLFGLLSLIYKDNIVLTNNYLVSLAFLLIGLILFYFFAKSKNTLSRLEALLLLSLYIFFLVTEYFLHSHASGWYSTLLNI